VSDPAVPSHVRQVSDPIAPILAASEDRPFVVAQLGQSLDGRIATISGESRWINNAGALDHLHRLRAAVDAVVVGVGTVMADDPKLNVRRVTLADGKPQPARVVIDPDGRMPSDRCCLVNDGSRRIIVTAAPAVSPVADLEIVRLDRHDGAFRPGEIVAALFALGLRRILVEGGATTISSFLDAGVLDRLHLLVGPVIIGSGKPGLQLRPVQQLSSAIRPQVTVHPLSSGDVIFDCDLRTRKAV
jgi:riboflavin-specific deaminase-like protein